MIRLVNGTFAKQENPLEHYLWSESLEESFNLTEPTEITVHSCKKNGEAIHRNNP